MLCSSHGWPLNVDKYNKTLKSIDYGLEHKIANRTNDIRGNTNSCLRDFTDFEGNVNISDTIERIHKWKRIMQQLSINFNSSVRVYVRP